MTGQTLLGIPIIVQITEAEKNRQARLDAAAANSSGHKEAPIHRLYIGNIHFSLTEDDIKSVFAPFGEIEQVQLQKEHDTGRSRGYGFVQYVPSSPFLFKNLLLMVDILIPQAHVWPSKN